MSAGNLRLELVKRWGRGPFVCRAGPSCSVSQQSLDWIMVFFRLKGRQVVPLHFIVAASKDLVKGVRTVDRTGARRNSCWCYGAVS
jgi:hypothetical protein